MDKIILVLKREYLIRVKKKSFIIMTFLAPALLAAILGIVVWIISMEDSEVRTIGVYNQHELFTKQIKDTKKTKFEFIDKAKFDKDKKELEKSKYYGLLSIPKNVLESKKADIYSTKQVPMGILTYIEGQMEDRIEKQNRLDLYNSLNIGDIDSKIDSTKTSISVKTFKVSEGGKAKRGSTGLSMGLAYAGGILIYMFIFIYGSQVMRGVIEEKTNRIVEVIISSVKPFQLMMGKIIGVALVAFTQLIAWIVICGLFFFIGAKVFTPNLNIGGNNAQEITKTIGGEELSGLTKGIELNKIEKKLKDIVSNIDYAMILKFLVSFLFYFIAGYLLYSSLFAAIGSAVDNETDTQQFMLPVTIPLIVAIYVVMNVFKNPESDLAYWCSIIPLTSPVVMIARIPFDVPIADLLISMGLLVVTFIGSTWLAAKIYRVGILMYGKKPTYKEIWKWINFKG